MHPVIIIIANQCMHCEAGTSIKYSIDLYNNMMMIINIAYFKCIIDNPDG